MVTWLSSSEGAEPPGVSRATLYAYVSRGLIRSSAAAGDSRGRRYAREDVERLRGRSEERRDPQKTAERALHFGVPVLESAITLISGDRLFYRGHDVAVLARTRSLEEVAALIWTGAFEGEVATTDLHVVAGGRSVEGLPFITRAQSMLPLVAARDPLALDLRPRSVAQTGWRILNLLASVTAESSQLADTLEETLRLHWSVKAPHAADLLRAALILCADHELNVSSFTARCVASAGANPYSVVVAGLSAIEGPKHGGMSARVETMFEELRRARDVKRALADRLRRGEHLFGFGHRLYENGDPRAKVLFELLQTHLPKSAEVRLALEIAEAGKELIHDTPTIDFAPVVPARPLQQPTGSSLTPFAIGCSTIWTRHAIQPYRPEEMNP